MKNKVNILFQIILWLLPWPLRKFFLKKILKFKLAKGARIGYSVVLADEVIIGECSAIRNFTIIKNIDRVVLGDYAYILNLNWITGSNTKDERHFAHVLGRRCELVIGNHSSLTSRHFIDCTGGINIGNYTTVGGAQSQMLTHYIDPYDCRQTCARIEIGNYCFVGTRALLLPGSGLPDYSILGGGSVLTKRQSIPMMIYAGNPAGPKKDLSNLSVSYFSRTVGAVD